MIPVWSYTDLLRLIHLDEDHGLDAIYQPNDTLTDLRCLIDCSDLFHWACADAEKITPADLDDIERCISDLEPMDATHWAGELFCCRRRQMRPQGPWYGYCDANGKVRRRFVPIAVEAIFDACGPERTDAPKPPRPADGRRWDYGGSNEPDDFVSYFQPGGRFGP